MLLQLFYVGQISAEGFHWEERRLAASIEAARMQAAKETGENHIESRRHTPFEETMSTLQGLDTHALWRVSKHRERRPFVEEMDTGLSVPDHLEVTVTGAPTRQRLVARTRNPGSDGPDCAVARDLPSDVSGHLR